MALLFLYHNAQLLLLVSATALAVFALVNLANINLITNLQTIFCLKRLAKCQKTGDLASFCNYVPTRYKHQWENYCKSTLPLAQCASYKPNQRKFVLISLAIMSLLMVLAVLVVATLYAHTVAKLVAVVLVMATGWIFALVCIKNKLVDKVSCRLWNKFVLQVGSVFDNKLPFVVASSTQVNNLVQQIKLLKLNPNNHQEIQRLLRQSCSDGVRTVKQQKQINTVLSDVEKLK